MFDATEKPSWVDKNNRIVDTLFCFWFQEAHGLRCINDRFYTKDGQIADESSIKWEIFYAIAEYQKYGVERKVNQLFKALKISAYAEPAPLQMDRIHVANGTYHLNGVFEEQKEFCMTPLPVPYHPQAQRPERWLNFLEELLYPEDIPTLQEYLGYCLIPSTKAQKMMMIVGKGGEGKSRIGLVMQRLLGDAMKNGNIQKVESDRFSRADLQDCLLMVDDDMDMNGLPKTNHLKSIVTAESKMDLERKGQQSYQGELYVRFLCFGNGPLTALYDHTDGFYRRQLILSTKDRPEDRQDDPFLVEKLCQELDGILLWCLEGLQRLLANGYTFTVSNRAMQNLDTLRRSSNNILDFLDSGGYIRFDAEAQISSRALYAVYKEWCDDNAYHPQPANKLSSELVQNAGRYHVEYTNNIYLPGEKRVRGFKGLGMAVKGHP